MRNVLMMLKDVLVCEQFFFACIVYVQLPMKEPAAEEILFLIIAG